MAIKSSYVIAGMLAVGLAGWLLSGQIGGDRSTSENVAAIETPERAAEPALVAVRVRELVAETIEREIVANGKTAPERSVQLRAETSGRVVDIGGPDGRAVERGELLITIDPRDRKMLALEARALLRQRRIELDAARKLGEKGFQAETAVAQAEASFATAEAVVKRADLELDHTTIEAPFAGILDRRHVEIGDFVDTGDPLATLLDQDPFLVTGEVSETEVGKLKLGMIGSIRLATGETLEGTLRYVASQADEGTRTFEVELEVPNPSGRLAAGISAEISVAVESVPAHRVSPSVLVLNDEGALGVKTVDGDDAVVFMPVDIAHAEEDVVWLTGLSSEIRLITVGQGFVSDGTKVRPVPASKGGDEGGDGPVVSEAVK